MLGTERYRVTTLNWHVGLRDFSSAPKVRWLPLTTAEGREDRQGRPAGQTDREDRQVLVFPVIGKT